MTRHRLITLLFTVVLTAMAVMAATRPSHDKKAILTLKNSITDDDIVFQMQSFTI